MTVPLLFGWESILTGLVVLVVLGVAFVLVSANRSNAGERSEWQAYLAARSRRGHDSDDLSSDRLRPDVPPAPRHGRRPSARHG